MGFSWENFDVKFMREVLLASDLSEKDKVKLEKSKNDQYIISGMLNTICDYPDKNFVITYRNIIEQSLLKYYPDEVRKICRAINVSGASFNEKQANMTKKATSASLIGAYISAILNISGKNIVIDEYSKFKYTVSLNMAETKTEEVPLYDFQVDAVDELKRFFIEDDKKRGMLVMPTGSGKSRTATTFLIKHMISEGYQILWIAHRHMLIDQAADCFYRFAGLSKIHNPKIRNYRISCISGEHLSCSQVGDSEVVVASISSICRNKAQLRRILGKKVMIVVDEAHHTLAPTYQDIISFIGKARKNTKLLGLTATPVRANDKDSKSLLKLYDNQVIYSVSMNDLIAKGILADPKFVRIETGEMFEPDISEDEKRLIQRYRELPESVVSKIASSHARNQMILNEYITNKEKYGKTLIFALNVLHCRFLHEELSARGVRCGLIYSGKDDNSEVINDFKENKIDVLVNVNIMTEGTDVPDIQTVFLTRPTQSEGLLMQMIGRGMRGTNAKGTKDVNIVDFYDKWDVFNKWLNPEWLIGCETSDSVKKAEYKPVSYIEYDWKLCQEIYSACVYEATEYGKTVSVPVAWYTLIDEEGIINRMLIFEDQMQGIVAMMKDKAYWKDDLSITAGKVLKKYFSYFCNRPLERDIQLLMYNVRENEIMPKRNIMKNRMEVEPYYVALKAQETGRDLFEMAEEIYDQNTVAQDLYANKEKYVMAVCRAKVYKDKSDVIGLKVEELPLEMIPFDRAPVYDIDELVKEVKEEMFGGSYEGITSIDWTDRPYRQYYGVYYYKDNSIRINQLLNSKDVPREVVKYIIYHEMLHRDMRYHDTAFREREHRYPDFEHHDHFLDSKMKMFDIREW